MSSDISSTLASRPAAPPESALVVLAPAAEPLVRPFRDRWDPSAESGVPAHITVLVPFHPPVAIAPHVIARLAQIFTRHAPFDYALTELRRFPDVLYLAPEPAEPFRALTQAVADAFPDYPPYGGRFEHVIPHLTVVEQHDPAQLAAIERDFLAAFERVLPLRLRAEAVVLVDNVPDGGSGPGLWPVRASFQLGG